jgi:Zn-dependent protease with chaperone function
MAGAFSDFFELQEEARRGTRRLVGKFFLATLGVIACFVALAALPFWLFLDRVPAAALHFAALASGGSILAVSARRLWQLREGGTAVAEMLGARRIAPGRCSATERRLLNVVEEIAIASGVAVPSVYCLDGEEGINALSAGYSPSEAAIVVTQAAMAKLTRDELQGMMAHEFSHILNGDTALNVRLAAVTAGLMSFAILGERLVYEAARRARESRREARGAGALLALGAAVMAFVGFPGALAADAIRAAISRQREFLADAASVQFTRNPEAIAGALDAVLALRAHTWVRAVHASEVSHMFFAQAVSHWWGFATHPPIAERIRRVHPLFRRQAYREHRGRTAQQREVAVLDGQGNIVKVLNAATVAFDVGKPSGSDLQVAVRLLAALPATVNTRLHDAEGVAALVFALALARDEAARERELTVLEARRGADAARAAAAAYAEIANLSRALALPVVEIALPVLKALPQAERDRLLEDLRAVVEVDGRVSFGQLVLATFVRQHLREGAGRAIAARYRSVSEVPEAARVVLSLLAHAGGEAAAAYSQAAAALGLQAAEPLPVEALTYARVCLALEALRLLAPLAKPRVLKACVDCAAADGRFRVAEVELLRAVAATLDCPLPPLVASLDPQELAA